MRTKAVSSASKTPVSYLTRIAIASLCSALIVGGPLSAAPYASKIRVTGTNVSFILNQPADSLGYRINNGPFQTLDGSTKGTKTFSLNAPTDTFAILAVKKDATGYTIPTGATTAVVAAGLSQITSNGGFNLISDDNNLLTRFNSPRGVSVANKPGSTNFGTVYIANSAAGATAGRTLGDGLYAMNADQSDAFAYGDTAQDPNNQFDGVAASANSPYRLFAAGNGEVYTVDFSDANGDLYRANFDLTVPGDGTQVFAGVGGPTSLPAGQNHGSITSVHVEGSLATSNLVVYTLDEDLRTDPVNPPDDRNSLWRYDIANGALPWTATPTKINQSNLLLPLANSDLHHGADGKWYLAQARAAGTEAGIFVLDAAGTTLYDSLNASRTLLGNPTAADILRNVNAMAVSEDQKWLAIMLNNSDVAVVPMVNGLPDVANRLVVDTGVDINSGRDIAFDAAGNIHYVSSGQARYRVLAPGGETWATTAWNGSVFSLTVSGAPQLTVTIVGNQVKIDWPTGVLQETTNLSAPFADSATQVSPYLFTPTGNMKFFRVRSP